VRLQVAFLAIIKRLSLRNNLLLACLMRTYKELFDLASSCANSARFSDSPALAYEFWQMAIDYQQSAAKLNDGKVPDIGDPPIVVVRSAPDYSPSTSLQ